LVNMVVTMTGVSFPQPGIFLVELLLDNQWVADATSKTQQKGAVLILNREQQEAVENGEPLALNVGGTECVLVRRDIYLRLDPDYDTGPWTTEEMNLLADEAEEMISRREAHEH
jgi:hypothetical protein